MKVITLRLVTWIDGNIVSEKPKMQGSFWQSVSIIAYLLLFEFVYHIFLSAL